MQGGGEACASSAPVGSFELDFLTHPAGVVQRTVNVSQDLTYTYLNADLVTDFGSEQTFKVKVYNVDGGLRSSAAEKVIVLQ
jgi:hypothetical protein